MFDNATKQQVLSSALRLRLASSALTRDFYDRLFDRAPELRAMFPADMSGQADKLFDMVLVLVQSLDHLQMLVAEIEALGVRHHEYGVTEEQYALVSEVLLDTLEHHVADWSEVDRKAWALLLGYVCDLMITGARDHASSAA
ncbi:MULTISPECIES: globin domain-containing protein [Salipiger]|uniref:globin domain-containing protein n=1 Tax=Salipiger TaxID=263377 RepID=UPI003518FACF